jgi:hypothetical protein
MSYLNSITLVGFVGSDPEQRQAKSNGSKFTVLSVATQRSWKNADDEWSSKTEWHRVVVFRPLLAERVATTIKKGAHVLVARPTPATRISPSCQHLAHCCHPPGVYLRHSTSELVCQVAATQMNIKCGCLKTSMPCERRDFVNVPVRARQIGQTQMTQCVRSEAGKIAPLGHASDCLGPGPDRDWLSVIATGL